MDETSAILNAFLACAEDDLAAAEAEVEALREVLQEIAGVPGEKPPAGWKLAEVARAALDELAQGGDNDD